jgi:hypothetical protein
LNFSVTVEILRAGETVPEVVVSSLDLDNNLTHYDTFVIDGEPPPLAPVQVQVGNDLRTFRFDSMDPRYLLAAAEEVMRAEINPLSDLFPATYDLGNGLCSTGDPGPTGIDGTPIPLSIEIGKGDTLIVQARKANDLPPGTWFVTNEPRLKGELLLNGQPVQVRGNTLSGPDPGAGFSFSFTSL